MAFASWARRFVLGRVGRWASWTRVRRTGHAPRNPRRFGADARARRLRIRRVSQDASRSACDRWPSISTGIGTALSEYVAARVTSFARDTSRARTGPASFGCAYERLMSRASRVTRGVCDGHRCFGRIDVVWSGRASLGRRARCRSSLTCDVCAFVAARDRVVRCAHDTTRSRQARSRRELRARHDSLSAGEIAS